MPLADLETGVAVPQQAKTIGQCCLTVLRQGDSPLASPGVPVAEPVSGRKSGDLGLLPMAIALAVALTAATIYLDLKIRSVADKQVEYQSELTTSLDSGSDVLQAIDQAMDGAARKSDVEALRERMTVLDGALGLQDENARQRSEKLRLALGAVRQEVDKLNAQRIDYRPLFDDLRQQIQRQAVAIADLRSGAATPTSRPPSCGCAPPAPGSRRHTRGSR